MKRKQNVLTKQISGQRLIIKVDGNEQKLIIFYTDIGVAALCVYFAVNDDHGTIKTKVKS